MIELIPAIDIIDGKCVRLSQGDYNSKKVYNDDPVEVAKTFESHGIRRLHMVDLDGAASHHVVNYRTLERITAATSLVVDFGGGVKTDEDLRIAFECGAQMVTGGSIAVTHPQRFEAWVQYYGADRIILGADVKNGIVAVNGWKETSTCKLFDFLDHYVAIGVRRVVCTDIHCDGMLQGPSVELYRQIRARYPDLYLIASGGVGCIDDIHRLNEARVPAVIFGKALYEGRIAWSDLEKLV